MALKLYWKKLLKMNILRHPGKYNVDILKNLYNWTYFSEDKFNFFFKENKVALKPVIAWNKMWSSSHKMFVYIRSGSTCTRRPHRPWPAMPLVLALVPPQKCPINFQIFQWKCTLQNVMLVLSKIIFQACYILSQSKSCKILKLGNQKVCTQKCIWHSTFL